MRNSKNLELIYKRYLIEIETDLLKVNSIDSLEVLELLLTKWHYLETCDNHKSNKSLKDNTPDI